MTMPKTIIAVRPCGCAAAAVAIDPKRPEVEAMLLASFWHSVNLQREQGLTLSAIEGADINDYTWGCPTCKPEKFSKLF